jgi:hypothetical protein
MVLRNSSCEDVFEVGVVRFFSCCSVLDMFLAFLFTDSAEFCSPFLANRLATKPQGVVAAGHVTCRVRC